MRLFLALELAPELIHALELAITPVQEQAPGIAWVHAEKRHVTLKFLGEVPGDRLERVVAFTETVATQHRPFSVELGGLGAFPNFRRARVVWIGVAHEARLELLQHDLEVAGESEGFQIEGRAFRPHVTLARVQGPLDAEHVRPLARAARAIDFTATQQVVAITLFESTPAQAGAPYRRLHVATLGGR